MSENKLRVTGYREDPLEDSELSDSLSTSSELNSSDLYTDTDISSVVSNASTSDESYHLLDWRSAVTPSAVSVHIKPTFQAEFPLNIIFFSFFATTFCNGSTISRHVHWGTSIW